MVLHGSRKGFLTVFVLVLIRALQGVLEGLYSGFVRVV